MIGEIIAIGDELTSGRILNSNSYFAASQLFAAGHEIIAMSTIGDSAEVIGTALEKALARAEFIVVTGGLGATSDDLTTEAAANTLGRPIIFYPEIFARISGQKPVGSGQASTRSQTHHLEKLAWLPSGAEVLNPDAKMAGYLLVHEEKPVFFLPGVPFEMKELLMERVLPYLAARKDHNCREVMQKVYKVFGLPETEINRKLADLEQHDPRIRIGYYPVFPEVHVSLTVLGSTRDESLSLFAWADEEINRILGENLFAFDADTMESTVGRKLIERKQTLAVAESCSGGLISHKLTKISGSSAFFLGGVVAYSNEMKESLLEVDRQILEQYGAVSAETARAMAEGIRRISQADYALSVTGIAGPTGGTAEKPVGTIYAGIAMVNEVRDVLFNFVGDRWQIQERTTMAALDLLRRELEGTHFH